MPWTANDARRFNRDLTAHQRVIWARVANRILDTCQADGGGMADCEARAVRQANAVASRAPAKAVKVDGDGGLSILAIPFGGPWPGGPYGKDFDGQYFSPNTDLCLDWFPSQRPLLYQHGLDDDVSVTPIGTVDVTSRVKDDAGWWVRAQLDKGAQYWRYVTDLLAADDEVLFASSGAMGHLVRVADDGEIRRWPWVELSLTPTPSNFFAIVEPATAKAHYKAAGLTPPPTIDIDQSDDDQHAETATGLTFADEAAAVLAANASFAARARSLAELRAKESRRLSRDTRRRMTAWMESLRQMLADAEDFMTSADADPEPPAKAAPPAHPEWARVVDEFRATQAFYGLVPAGEK